MNISIGDVFHLLQLIVLAFSIMIIIHISLRKDRQAYSNVLLNIFFMINILGLSMYLIIATGLIEHLWFLYRIFLPLTAAGAGVAYLYIKSVLSDDLSFHKKDLWHTIPFFLCLIQYLPYYLSSAEEKKAIITRLLDQKTTEYVMNIGLFEEQYFSVFRGLVYLIYAVLIFQLIKKYDLKALRSSISNTRIQRRVYTWLMLYSTSFIINLLAMALYIILNLFGLGFENNLLGLLKLVSVIFFNLSILVYTAYLLIYPETLIGIYQPRSRKESKNDTQIALTSEIKSLTNALEKEKIYRQPGIKLIDLSTSLQIAPRKLSYIINSQYDMNFNELINDYRIKEAVLLIEEGYLEKYTAEYLGEVTGFQNKTSFYKAFKAKTGTTPTSFLRKTA